MKKILLVLLFLFAAAATLLAQVPPTGEVVLPVPGKIILSAVQVLIIGKTVMTMINGIKDMIPGLSGNTLLLRILSFVTNLLANTGGCFLIGQIQGTFDVLQCVGVGIVGALVSAGFYKEKRDSDISRAAPSISAFKVATEEPVKAKDNAK